MIDALVTKRGSGRWTLGQLKAIMRGAHHTRNQAHRIPWNWVKGRTYVDRHLEVGNAEVDSNVERRRCFDGFLVGPSWSR